MQSSRWRRPTVYFRVVLRTLRASRNLAERFATGAALRYAFLVLLFGALVGLLGFWGINLTDGGLILAYGHRILAGEVPHQDFITPRPAGSAVLHLVEFASPLPLLLTSKLVTLAEFVAYGVFFSLLIYGKRLAQLNAFELCGVVVAVLVGIHQFPIIDFYTMDGLLFVGLGFLLLRRSLEEERPALVALGFASLGVATTVKQSFWFAPFLAFVWVIGMRVAERRGALAVWSAAAGAACAAAPALYVAFVTLGGGFSEMRSELTGAQAVWGSVLLNPFRSSDTRAHLMIVLMATIALAGFIHALPRIEARLPNRRLLVFSAASAARAALTTVILVVALDERLKFSGATWSIRLFWCTLAVLAVRLVVTRRLDVAGFLVVFTAWMVTLSWGAPTPGLAAGACTVYLADAIWRGQSITGSSQRRMCAAGAVLGTLLVVLVFVDVRTNADYGIPRSAETVLLGEVSDELSGVYTDPKIATYLRDLARCTKRYEAKWVAVVPEGALTYPALHLRNPFPIDWFWADDYRGAHGRERLLAAASRTDARGNYLVLFQTAPLWMPVSDVRRDKIAPFPSDLSLADQLASRLRHATPAVCGGFVAFYRAGR